MTYSSSRSGHFRPGHSSIHRLDPRTKIIGLLILSTASLMLSAPASLTCLACLVFAGYLLSGIPVFELIRGLRGFLWLFTFTAILQLFFTPGDPLIHVPFMYWGITITREGLAAGAVLFGKLSVVIATAHLITATTSPNRLSGGLGKLIAPLGRIGLPVDDIVLAFSIGLQFLPILARELEDIRNAQISRGIGHLDANPFSRLLSMQALMIPLLTRAVQRADQLTLAMISRGYRQGVRRTSLNPLVFSTADAATGTILVVSLVLSIMAGNINTFN